MKHRKRKISFMYSAAEYHRMAISMEDVQGTKQTMTQGQSDAGEQRKTGKRIGKTGSTEDRRES